MIDTHAHLTDKIYQDIGEIITNAKNEGVTKIITVGCNEESSFLGKEIAENNQKVFFTVGVHPSDCEFFSDELIAKFKPIIAHEKCLAIGEIGLDYHYGKDNKEKQKSAFIAQLKLACELDLPVVIHSREATKDMIDILSDYAPKLKRGFLMHCYSESLESAKEYLKLGGYFAFGGAITFKNAKKEDIIKNIPIERVMCETDCPYMSPVPYRGQVNEPKRVAIVYQAMADIYQMSLQKFTKQVAENAVRFFGEKQLGE